MPHSSIYSRVTFERWEKGACWRDCTCCVRFPWLRHEWLLVETGESGCKRTLCAWQNSEIEWSLRKTCVQSRGKALASALTPCIYLQCTGCLTVKKFSQPFLWAGEGSPSSWRQGFLKRSKPVPNLIEFFPVTSLQSIGLIGKVHSLPPSPILGLE